MTKLFNYFKELKENIVRHLFCSYCKRYIGVETNSVDEPCLTCGRKREGNESFFVGVPIDGQIQNLFKGKYLVYE